MTSMRRTLSIGIVLCGLVAPIRAMGLELQVEPGDKADRVIVNVQMSSAEYKAAKGQLGGGKAVADYRVPGSSEVNLRMPMSKAKYEAVRKQALDRKGQGPYWCVTCTGSPDAKPTTLRARTSLAASLISTSACETATKSQNNKVTGPGACPKSP